MSSNRTPGPICQEERPFYIDEGTMCLAAMPPPGSVGRQPNAVACETGVSSDLDEAIHVLEAEALSFAIRFIPDTEIRLRYVSQVKEYSKAILDSVREGKLSAQEAAGQAVEMRNQILDASRLRSSDIGKAVAEQIKAKGLRLEQLQEKYAQGIFKKSFTKLTKAETDAVYLEIVNSSGRANPKFTSRALKLGRLGKGLLVVTVAVSVYNIVTAEDKVDAVAREGLGFGGGMLGGAAGGAVAGLACGPGAPVCVTAGVFIGGALGALGADFAYEWAK